MKGSILNSTLGSILSTAVSLTALASYNVCSSPSVYYNESRSDYGTPPPKGAVMGSLLLVIGSDTVENLTFKYDETSTIPNYNVVFNGDSFVLEHDGNKTFGHSISTVTMNITKEDGSDVVAGQKVLTEKVVCQEMHALVP